MGSFTRRRALVLMFTGAAMISIDSGAFSNLNAERPTEIAVSDDGNAVLGLQGFAEGTVYKEPQEVTVENNTEGTLDANQVSSVNNDLQFRNPGTTEASQTLSLPPLESTETDSFEIVTSPNETGEVTDTVALRYSGNHASIEVVRDITVEFKAGGQLVYAVDGSINVYDAVNDMVKNPPQSETADVIGANAANVVADGNADIPYLDKNGDLYATWINADSDRALNNPKKPKLKKSKTRLALRPWDPASLDGNLILSANKNADAIIGIDSDGNTETVATLENGCVGVAGVKDIDSDGQTELVFVDGSAQMRYLEQNGTTSKIEGGSVGSNNSTGFGQPADFGRGEGIEIPFIDGSQNPALIDAAENEYLLNNNSIAKKAAVAPVDIDGDGTLEFMFLGESNGNIRYIDNVGAGNDVKTLEINGSTVTPDEKVGLNSGA